jgi:hypothetical protein
MYVRTITVCVLFLWCVGFLRAGEVAFDVAPKVTRSGGKVEIGFAVSEKTDVEVAILDAKGKVVRHLAGGVVGAEKVAPPLVKGLSQSLVWDGHDDFKKPAKGGPFKVRVRAGLGVKFGRMIGEDPYTFGQVSSIATDQDGKLYVSAYSSECYQSAQILRSFTPEGKYLRTLIPFAADLAPAKVPANVASWDATRKTFVPRNYTSGNPAIYALANARIVSVSKKAGVIMTSGATVWRMDIDGGNVKKLGPMWSPAAKLKNARWNAPQLAVSPDGRYIYYSNVAGTQYEPKKFSDTDPKWPQGRVYRQDTSKPGSDPQTFYDLVLPDWNEKKFWLPNAWNCRTAAHDIEVDAKGHLHIGDLVNQEIVEVGPDGKKIGATKVAWPERFYIDPKSGAYYVFSRMSPLPGEKSQLKLVKITGRGAAAKVVTELPLFLNIGRAGLGACLGKMGGAPALWIGARKGLICVKDTGTKFELVETAYLPRPDAQLDWGRIAVNSKTDEVYTNNSHNHLWRYDGKTGKGELLRKNGKTFYGVDMSVGYDGLLYIRTGRSFAGPLERYTSKLDPAPFPGTGTHKLYDIYSRMGIGYCDKGVGAGPKGESYVSYMYDWNKYFVAGFAPDGKPIKGKFLDGKFKKPDAKSLLAKLPPERLITTAVIGPIPASSGGIVVDLDGNIYVGMLALPNDFVAPEGFEKDPAYANWTGSIVKFAPGGGTVLGAVKDDDQTDAKGAKTECKRGLTIVGAMNVYPGLAPFSGRGFGGNSSSCVCRVPRFAVDRYGRIAYTSVVTCSATLIDNAGNRILEFGSYGNFDSKFVNPNTDDGKSGEPTVAVPEMPLAWPTGAGLSGKHIYVNDTYNKRVLRVDKTWQAEETIAVK